MEMDEIIREFEDAIQKDLKDIDTLADNNSHCIPVDAVRPSVCEGDQNITERYINLGKILSYIMENKFAAGIEFYEDDEADKLTILDLHEHDLFEYGKINNII